MWHRGAIEEVAEILSRDRDVKGLLLLGSCSMSYVQPDAWSDIDMAVVVDDAAIDRFYPSTDWVRDFGVPYALNRNKTDDYSVLRVWFVDGRRLDSVVITESSLERIDEWDSNPLYYGYKLLFSRSSVLDAALSRKFPLPIHRDMTDEQFRQLSNDFWFKGMQAVAKAARNELLVAVHLTLDMVQDCLLLGMAIRDRETGTNHHRDGSMGNHLIAELDRTVQPYTAEGVLNSIEQCAIAYDRLALKWDKTHADQRQPLLELITAARA